MGRPEILEGVPLENSGHILQGERFRASRSHTLGAAGPPLGRSTSRWYGLSAAPVQVVGLGTPAGDCPQALVPCRPHSGIGPSSRFHSGSGRPHSLVVAGRAKDGGTAPFVTRCQGRLWLYGSAGHLRVHVVLIVVYSSGIPPWFDKGVRGHPGGVAENSSVLPVS